MNQQLAKTLSRYAKKNGFDVRSVRNNFKKLDPKSKERLLAAMRNVSA